MMGGGGAGSGVGLRARASNGGAEASTAPTELENACGNISEKAESVALDDHSDEPSGYGANQYLDQQGRVRDKDFKHGRSLSVLVLRRMAG